MSVTSGPNLSSSGLIFAYDMYNTKSYVGASVTNLLPTPTINSVPTTSNGWGTYNTNQYGSGTYFSIGTVASVSGNIVTMTAAHSLRSYDVMQPQSSGGGVTGGTNYLIKKLSSTTFSLHPYNGSQDGSQGYINPATGTHKVYDNFATDVKISINSSGFPTMWWGAPHLPNSGLVKEIRTDGCSIPGYPTTDCMRLYHTRPDGVTDGMAYGVDTPVTAGVAHTVSFWTKTVNAAAVGQSISYQIYNYGVVSPAGYSFSATLGPVGVWVKHSMTFTPVNPTCISYFFPSSGNIIYDLAHIQIETGSVANSWTNSSRSTTQAILDLTNNDTITATSLTYNSDGTFSFNGSNNYMTATGSAFTSGMTAYTIMFWARRDAESRMPVSSLTGTSFYWYGDNSWKYQHGGVNGEHYYSKPTSIPLGTWGHYCVTYNGSTISIYRQGILQSSVASSGTADWSMGMQIGYWQGGSGYQWQGRIDTVSMYNKALSATEVQQNFNALRGRYGI